MRVHTRHTCTHAAHHGSSSHSNDSDSRSSKPLWTPFPGALQAAVSSQLHPLSLLAPGHRPLPRHLPALERRPGALLCHLETSRLATRVASLLRSAPAQPGREHRGLPGAQVSLRPLRPIISSSPRTPPRLLCPQLTAEAPAQARSSASGLRLPEPPLPASPLCPPPVQQPESLP